MQTQIATLNTNTRYLSDLMVQYAERITATLPIISDVRGHGFMKDRGYLLSTDGPLYSVLKIKPQCLSLQRMLASGAAIWSLCCLTWACVSTLGGAL